MDSSEDLQNRGAGLTSEAGNGSENIASPVLVVNTAAPNNNAEQDEKEDDAVSIQTTTDDLLGEGTETSLREHKLGLDINFPWGWSGSSYDDYEYGMDLTNTMFDCIC